MPPTEKEVNHATANRVRPGPTHCPHRRLCRPRTGPPPHGHAPAFSRRSLRPCCLSTGQVRRQCSSDPPARRCPSFQDRPSLPVRRSRNRAADLPPTGDSLAPNLELERADRMAPGLRRSYPSSCMSGRLLRPPSETHRTAQRRPKMAPKADFAEKAPRRPAERFWPPGRLKPHPGREIAGTVGQPKDFGGSGPMSASEDAPAGRPKSSHGGLSHVRVSFAPPRFTRETISVPHWRYRQCGFCHQVQPLSAELSVRIRKLRKGTLGDQNGRPRVASWKRGLVHRACTSKDSPRASGSETVPKNALRAQERGFLTQTASGTLSKSPRGFNIYRNRNARKCLPPIDLRKTKLDRFIDKSDFVDLDKKKPHWRYRQGRLVKDACDARRVSE